jgi:chemotaxis protein methyltransferase CheR
MSPDHLVFFSSYIERETGIIYSDSNLYQLKARLDELIRKESLKDLEDLQSKLVCAGNEIIHRKLIDLATNNETHFFRDPSFFEGIIAFLEKEILPQNPTEIRIWSAASSTGQEALSVAMTLEQYGQRRQLPPYKILATDICERVLTKCKSHFYTEFETTRGMSPAIRQQFFTPVEGGWKVNDRIAQKVSFDFNNLIRPTVTGSFHLILCRNVLIYQTVDRKKEVVRHLFKQLAPKGGLILGVGETLLGVSDEAPPKLFGNVAFYQAT